MFSDLRFAFRQIGRAPAHSATVVLILALGIGANTAIFSLLHSVLLKPVTYPEPERLMVLRQRYQETRDVAVAWPSYLDWRKDNRSFSALGLGQRDTYTLTGRGDAEQIMGAAVSAEYFQAIALQPELGRCFTTDEDRVGAPGVVVIRHALWQRKFGGSPDALGQSLTLNGKTYTVIGVMPADLVTPRNAEFWIPITPLSDNQIWQDRGNNPGLFALGRLKPGVTLEQARADLKAIGLRINRDFPAETANLLPYVEPLVDSLTKNYRSSLWLLSAAVSLLLLVACTNVASLQFARGLSRENEMSIRAALGSSRARLVRQLLTENLVLALLGGAAGVALTFVSLDVIRTLSPDTPQFKSAELSGTVLGFSLVLSMLAGVLFGLWPAWRASRTDLRSALQSGGRSGSASPARQLTRQGLLALQVALTVALLAGAALFGQSLANIQRFQFGFDSGNLLVFRVSLPQTPAYAETARRLAFYDALETRLAALPGVKFVGHNHTMPLRAGWDASFDLDGREPFPQNARPSMQVGFADANYFQTMGIPLLKGRTFNAADKAGSPAVIVVDQALAGRFWPGEDPIGKAITWGPPDAQGSRRRTIIGVVPSVDLYGYQGGPKMYQVYFADSQWGMNEQYVQLRTEGNPLRLVEAARAAVASLDANVPLHDAATMEQMIDESFTSPRLISRLLDCFAGAALLLAALGIYGVVAYAVRARQREIGIRLALGALPRQVVSLVVRHGLLPLAAGLPLGLLGSVAFGRLIASQLYHVSPFDAPALATACAAPVALALAALWLPARRAARTDPMVALRTE
ncbi:MAG: ABC transporter permease [Opitutae bacterium]|nr:ABC transporter permease [Opitutae bacterium]